MPRKKTEPPKRITMADALDEIQQYLESCDEDEVNHWYQKIVGENKVVYDPADPTPPHP